MAPSCDLKSSLNIAGLIPQEAEVYAGTLNQHIIQELPEPQQPKQELPVSQIPADKLKAMQDYARKLKRNSPGMKMERLQRKVAEKFKVKIV